MKISRFEELVVWQRSRRLSLEIYRATNAGAFSRDFGLRDQVRRAAVSIMSNIAEGFGRFTSPEVRRFLSIARGSAAEVRSQLYLALDLGYITADQHRSLNALCIEIERMLAALRTSLDPQPKSRPGPLRT
jgi:four helix bundle protein